MGFPLKQLESALVIALRDTIKWESALAQEVLPINPELPLDAAAYQARDRALAFRDLVVGAAVVEASVQVSNVYNSSVSHPSLQGAVYPVLTFSGTNAGLVNSQVRHVLQTSIPWDAARFADCDLYGRDALAYEVLARACREAFSPSPLPVIDSTGTVISDTDTWSLAEGAVASADINPAQALNRDLFKAPDQNLADRDNQIAGYVAQMVQRLKNPFEHAIRLYVQLASGSRIEREAEVYALISDDGVNRVFQTEPALPNANRIIYSVARKTLQWTRERTDEIHVPQIYALAIPGIEAGQVISTIPAVPSAKDCQYWRSKAGQIVPAGEAVADVSAIRYTYTGDVTGGLMQANCASLTSPGAVEASLPSVSEGSTHRVSVLVKPCPVVEIPGGLNVSATNGTNGGVDWEIGVASGDVASKVYYVDGGDGVVYKGVTYLPGTLVPGDAAVTTYTQAGALPSTLRQSAVYWNVALPPGAWTLQIEYADLSGQNTGLGVRADYAVPGYPTVSIAKDVVELTTSGTAGALKLSEPYYLDVASPQPFALSLHWTYGSGQLHVRRLVFSTTSPVAAGVVFNGTLGNQTAVASFTATHNQPEVIRMDFAVDVATGDAARRFVLASSSVPIPIQIEAIDVQTTGSYTHTPLAAAFQGWRQECLDRAERVVQQGYNQTVNSTIPTPVFRDSGSHWTETSTERWMSLAEVSNPRLREMTGVIHIASGRYYEAVEATVYNGTNYTTGDRFYGVDGATDVSQPVKQVGAFVKASPGHVGRPCLIPRGLYYDDSTGRAKAYWDSKYSVPVVVTCQPWMVECGIYTAQPEFWMPDVLGPDLPEIDEV